MKRFRTAVSVLIMVIAGLIGFFVGSALDGGMNGAILFSLVAGMACMINAIDNREE